MRAVILLLIRGYQTVISPWLPASCRYTPSCSEYARVAVETHGAARGSWMAARRLARCHPFGPHGHDPVPPAVHGASGSDGTDSARASHRGAC
ncbi:MAG: membrane protein insertion efficiency factor YidD [Gemmatimonadota bacterium]|nr:membrane protein insertion efficiency factor YidD [Gemmatimonadota bacterium]